MSEILERFYDFDKIKDAANCLDVAIQQLGMIPVKGKKDMFNIPWRDGSDSGALSINATGWHDFVTKDSGGVIDLVRRVRYPGENEFKGTQLAAQFLGDLFHIPDPMIPKADPNYKTRVDYLKEDGYIKTATYKYHDENNELRHYVERWEHETKKKEFVQFAANGRASLKDVDVVLYRLPEWIDKQRVAIVEGEKDVDNLFKHGAFATTNPSGAGKWQDEWSELFSGKDVTIFTDNDDAGRSREAFLLWELKGIAKSLKVIRFDAEVEGFDVSDYLEKYSISALAELVKGTQFVDMAALLEPADDYRAIEAAKVANKKDIQNYIEFTTEKGDKVVKPQQINALLDDFRVRFLGFPRRVGGTLFDHDRKSRDIVTFRNDAEFFAWAAQKSKRLIPWKNGGGFVSKKEFFAALHQSAQVYEEISYSPVYPPRTDAYRAYPPLPKPDPEHRFFTKLVSFFNPVNDFNRVLLKTLIAAPLYYERNIPRPCWIIDSVDGPGAGKTTMVELIALLYGHPAIRKEVKELHNKTDEVMKSLVTSSGRQSRVFLLDNVDGVFHSPIFADMVTASMISGRPPYGTKEEFRPNNLTYVITSNNAQIDSDISQRSYILNIKHPTNYSATWKTGLLNYIEKHRYEIIADIVDMVTNHKPFELPASTRFPEFEVKILQSFCKDDDEYNSVVKVIADSRDNANVEREMAERVEECIEEELRLGAINPEDQLFIRAEAVNCWVKRVLPKSLQNRSRSYIMGLARQGHTKHIDGDTERMWGETRRGFFWNKISGIPITVVGISRDGKAEKIIKA